MRPYYRLSGTWGLTQLSTGQPFYVDTEEHDITPWIIMGGAWETFVDNVLCALARPGDVFVDVGANMGYYTVKLGGLVGAEGKVFSFEANPLVFEFLRENININGLAGRTRAICAAAGAKVGEIDFSFDRAHPGGGMVLLEQQAWAGHQVTKVQVVDIDSVVPLDCSAHLIKLDVEGFEPSVFAGMKGLLDRSPDAAIVSEMSYEAWERFGDPAKLLSEFSMGRQIFRIAHSGELHELQIASMNDAFDRGFISYVLMLPRTAEREAQIAPLLAGYLAPPPVEIMPITPVRRPSIVRRLLNRVVARVP